MLNLTGERLTLDQIEAVASSKLQVSLSPDSKVKMQSARVLIESIIETGKVVYGVNTGFGKLSDVTIPRDQIESLQLNLVRSHACGVGAPLSEPESRVMLLLRANVLAKGFSGARPVVAETLIQMLNSGVHPIIPQKGSVGASGDLAPLAHLALVLIGEGEAVYQGKRMTGGEAMNLAGISVLSLQAKEGLALLNGTQAITAVGALAAARMRRLIEAANHAGAMTLEALLGTPVAFDERIHSARPHSGQIWVARQLRELLENSEIRNSHVENDPRVQDAYSLRCMPQVHGAVLNALEHVREVLEIESGSATDNPLVFAEQGDVLSGGNFHGAPLSGALDYLALSLTDLASISERRIDRLVNPDMNENLPAFLTSHPGSGSGFMIAHVTAVALLNECKVLSHPASVDNAPTSAGKEDHVSMGMTAALKFKTIVENVEHVLAIELMVAAEGLEYRKPLRPGKRLQRLHDTIRSVVPRLGEDRQLSVDIEKIAELIRSNRLLN